MVDDGAVIDINDDGADKIAATDEKIGNAAKEMIEEIMSHKSIKRTKEKLSKLWISVPS